MYAALDWLESSGPYKYFSISTRVTVSGFVGLTTRRFLHPVKWSFYDAVVSWNCNVSCSRLTKTFIQCLFDEIKTHCQSESAANYVTTAVRLLRQPRLDYHSCTLGNECSNADYGLSVTLRFPMIRIVYMAAGRTQPCSLNVNVILVELFDPIGFYF